MAAIFAGFLGRSLAMTCGDEELPLFLSVLFIFQDLSLLWFCYCFHFAARVFMSSAL